MAGFLNQGIKKLTESLISMDPNLRASIAIGLGAIPGALSRYYLSLYCTHLFGTEFPVGTLIVNITGAFLIGLFITYLGKHAIVAPELKLLVTVGFLGSYTTFSTYALDTVNLWRSNSAIAIAYLFGSPLLGILGLELATLLARKFP